MAEAGAGQVELLRQAGWGQNFFNTPSLSVRPRRVSEAVVPPLQKTRSMRAAKLMNLAVFLGIPLAAAALVLARIGPALLETATTTLSAITGIDIDFGDDVAQAVQSGEKDLVEPSPKRMFDTKVSVVTIQGDGAHDVDAADVDEETGFKAEPIEASPLHGYYDRMTCENLRDAIRNLEVRKAKLVSTNFGGINDNRIEKIGGALEIAETVRLGKLLGGDTLCNF